MFVVIFSFYYAENPSNTEISDDSIEEQNSGVVFTGNLVYGEALQKDVGEYIFNVELEEKARYVVEGTFNQPVNLLVLPESYYTPWLETREVKTNTVYIKDHTKDLYARFDVNTGGADTYYVILRSETSIISGNVRIIKVADL